MIRSGPADGVEDVLGDEGGHGDEDPLLPGAGHLAFAAAAGGGNHLGLVVVEPPDVGLVAQDAGHRGGAPGGFAGGGGNLIGVESDGDGPDGVPAGHVVVEDPAHHRRFRFVDNEVGGPSGGAGKAAVAVGNLPGEHLPRPGPPQLGPPVTLRDLGSLILGDDPLHLGQQAGLGIVVDGGSIGETHHHPVTGELVENHHLVGVVAGQTIGGQTPHLLEGAGFGGVAQRVETGPVQTGTGVAVVDELGHQTGTLGRHPLPERVELGTDGASGFLSFGRHPGVDRHPGPGFVLADRADPAATIGVGPAHANARPGSSPAADTRSSKPSANATSRGSSCGDHAGRRAPTTLTTINASATGATMRPARPLASNRAATSSSAAWPSSTAARSAS